VVEASKKRWDRIEELSNSLKKTDSSKVDQTTLDLIELTTLIIEQLRPLYQSSQKDFDEVTKSLEDMLGLFGKMGAK
jgi:hypothetical protein